MSAATDLVIHGRRIAEVHGNVESRTDIEGRAEAMRGAASPSDAEGTCRINLALTGVTGSRFPTTARSLSTITRTGPVALIPQFRRTLPSKRPQWLVQGRVAASPKIPKLRGNSRCNEVRARVVPPQLHQIEARSDAWWNRRHRLRAGYQQGTDGVTGGLGLAPSHGTELRSEVPRR